MDVIAALELSPGAQAQLNVCVNSLTDRSKSQLEPFLTFLLQYMDMRVGGGGSGGSIEPPLNSLLSDRTPFPLPSSVNN